MADDAQPRKLATIVALDVAGYSARTEANEAKATAEVAALRKVIEAIATGHGGRVFNTAGDGFMLEFGSSLAGVEAAFELAQTCEPKVRIGVHVGDVVPQPNGDLLGHGVNVAARLMAQAEPGSTLISADVKHMMRGPLVQSLRSKGTIKLAKMSETIEVFAFLPEAPLRQDLRSRVNALWPKLVSRRAPSMLYAGLALLVMVAAAAWMLIAPAPPSAPALPGANQIPDASIAVMPFENLSADKDNAFFTVGIQDEILTRLTKIGSLKVISRTSTANMASRPHNLPEIAKQLGVATILEGSVQRDGNSVRVNVQLTKAATDTHLWAEVYDRKLDNIFSVQSEIAIAIANALNAKVSGEEKQSLEQVPTKNPDAYDAYLRGLVLYYADPGRYSGLEGASKLFGDAVRLDPGFALAWARLARSLAQRYPNDEQAYIRDAARAAADTALRLQPDLPEAQLALGFYRYFVERDYEAARRQFELVQAAWPNDIEVLHAMGLIARRQGRWNESKSYFERAVWLDPLRVDMQARLIGTYAATRDFVSALRTIDLVLARFPEDILLIAYKARLLQANGRIEEAGALLKPLQARADDRAYKAIFEQAMLERKYATAFATLQSLKNPAVEVEVGLGRLRSFAGDKKGAAAHFERARGLVLGELARQPKNSDLLGELALIHCYSGDRENALKYVEKAIGITPASMDATHGRALEDARMRIWAYFGDREHAIPEIGRLLAASYEDAITPALLRLDPIFDKLRGDPRFEALARGDIKPK